MFGLKEIERKCEFPKVVHTIPDHRWYTPYQNTGNTSKYPEKLSDTYTVRQARTYKHTHVTYAKKHTHAHCAAHTT